FCLVVEQFFTSFRRELEVRPFDDRVHRASFLTEAAVDALGHVDVIARGTATAVFTRFCLDGDRLRRTHRFTQLARNAALFPVGIAAQRMFAPEARAERVLLEWIVDRR